MTKSAATAQTNAVPNALAAARTEARSVGHAAGKTEGHQAGKVEGLREGAGLERKRIAAILNCTEANQRTELAAHLAFKTEMSEADAIALLAMSPKQDMREIYPFAAAMQAVANPSVGPNDCEGGSLNDDQKAAELAAQVLAAHRNASGR